MKDRIQSVCDEHVDANGDFRWPTTEADRNMLASRLFGACIVAGMDYWIEKAIPSLQSGFSAEQQLKIKQVLFQSVRGVIFSILVKLDQFPFASLDLVLRDPEKEEKLASVFDGEIFDLHDRLCGWLKAFSNFPNEFGA